MRTSEQVSPGHPDKVCDQISDSILDEYLKTDSDARVAVETLAYRDGIVLAGEITSSAKVDHVSVVRDVIDRVGYTELWWPGVTNIPVYDNIHPQSPNLNKNIVDGAGDQGIVYGYACLEPKMLPREFVMSTMVTKILYHLSRKFPTRFGPDSKSTVTVDENGKPVLITCSILHSDSLEDTRDFVGKTLGRHFGSDVEIRVNPAGDFTVGGPTGDTGLTGRKIIADTYGGRGRHGGGAFSGKDATKVDRTGAYLARKIAIDHLAQADDVYEVEVQLGWQIGNKYPISVEILEDGAVVKTTLDDKWKMSPLEIAREFGLLNPLHRHQSAFGHFYQSDLPWNTSTPFERVEK